MTRRHAFAAFAVSLLAASCGTDGDSRATTTTRPTGAPTSTTTTTTTTVASTLPTSRPTTTTTKSAEPGDGRLVLPHWNPGAGIGAVAVNATGITGDQRLGCVWITYANAIHPAIWPPGTYALFSPLRVFDSSGTLLWTEGEAKTFGGSPKAEGDTSAVPAKCQNGQGVAVVGTVK